MLRRYDDDDDEDIDDYDNGDEDDDNGDDDVTSHCVWRQSGTSSPRPSERGLQGFQFHWCSREMLRRYDDDDDDGDDDDGGDGITQSSSEPYGAWGNTRDLHLALSAAVLGAVSRLSPLLFSTFSTVLRHVSFGRPRFLLPWVVQHRAVLGNEVDGMRHTCTCPSHLQTLCLVVMVLWL